jgi:hypothetical protein
MADPAVEVRGVRRTYTSRKGFFFNEVTKTEALKGVAAYVAALGLWQVSERQATRTGSIIRF